jgi:hypothetical protein
LNPKSSAMRFGSCFDHKMRCPGSSDSRPGRYWDRAKGTRCFGLQPVFALCRFVRIYPLFLTEQKPISAHHITVRMAPCSSRGRAMVRASTTFSHSLCFGRKLAERRRVSMSSSSMGTLERVSRKFRSRSTE